MTNAGLARALVLMAAGAVALLNPRPCAALAAPQRSSDAQPAPAANAAADSAVQLDQIKTALGRPPALKLDDQQLRFYIQVVAKQPRFADYVKGYDFINGPTKGGNPMSHSEFVNMVTPKELHSSAGITASEMLQGAFTNWMGQKLIKRALDDIKNAHSDKEVQEIRDRIDRELAALNASASN